MTGSQSYLRVCLSVPWQNIHLGASGKPLVIECILNIVLQ